MVQSLGMQKLVSKITGIWTISEKQWKVQRVEIWWSHSAKTYTVDLSNITFNYLCVDSPNYLCHFWNHKLFFTTQYYILFTKSANFRLSTAQVKVHQNSSCHFSDKKSVFPQSLGLFSVSWERILLYFLGWNFICYW